MPELSESGPLMLAGGGSETNTFERGCVAIAVLIFPCCFLGDCGKLCECFPMLSMQQLGHHDLCNVSDARHAVQSGTILKRTVHQNFAKASKLSPDSVKFSRLLIQVLLLTACGTLKPWPADLPEWPVRLCRD